MKDSNVQTVEPRQNKHIQIACAISRLDAVTDNLDHLISMLNNTDCPGHTEEGTTSISFSELLNTGATSIDGKIDQANERIQAIREILF